MRTISFFFLTLIPGIFAVAFAQNPYIRHYTTSNGLPTNTIYQIYQDSQKFLWFTSDAGVVKYDGSDFTSYRKKDGLSSNDVVRIKEDYKGRIWFFNYNASANFYYNNQIYNSSNAPFLNSLVGKGFILDFFTDSRKRIHFYNWQGDVFMLDANNKVSQDLLFKNPSLLSPSIAKNLNLKKVVNLGINESDEWVMWTSGGIYRQDILQKNSPAIIDSSLKCMAVFPAMNDTYYLTTYTNEIIKISGKFQKQKIPFHQSISKIKTIFEDSSGFLWIAAYDQGVFCLKSNKIVRHFDMKDALGLLQDHEQNIWVSTQSNGIYVINHDLLEQDHFDRANFDNYGVNQLCDFPGTGIWCTNTKSAFLLKNNTFYKLSAPLQLQPVNILYQFKDLSLLLGSISNGLCIYKNLTLNDKTKEVNYSAKNIQFIKTKKIFDDRSGNVVAMINQDVIRFFDPQKHSFGLALNQITERINNAFYNLDNELVINAKKNYLYRNNKLETYPQLSRFNGTIISDHLIMDNSSELFNIDGDSLYILNKNRFYNLTRAFDSPVDKQINKILFSDSSLYLATLNDVFVCHNPNQIISGKPLHIEPLNISFNNINDILIHDDTLFIASDDGLTVIAEASIYQGFVMPPRPYLRSITVNDKIYALTEQELKLTGKNKIQLSFGCISYSASPVIYSYMLEGSENEWTVGTGSRVDLVYQNLAKGNYTFKLRVRKSNSDWSKPLELAVTIKPTLVEYPAFWAIVVLLASGLIFLIISLVRIEKMKKVEVDHQLIVMEQKALQSMMNPHFIFNSLGSIQNYLLKNKGNEAVIYLSQFASLIRQNLNAVNTPMIILEEETDRLRNYIELEKKRLENKFEYSIEIDSALEEESIFIPSMIIQPIVENSIWHGIAALKEIGTIRIRFQSFNSKSLKVVIQDNGIGMDRSQEYTAKSTQHTHLGMQIIRKRLDLLSKKYKTETSITYSEHLPDQKHPGTAVEIIMPFIYSFDDL